MNAHRPPPGPRPGSRVVFAIALAAGSVACTRGVDASNPAILQWFDSTYMTQEKRVADFFMAGYGTTWIPPTGRADSGNQSVGYDVFDRFDLGSTGRPTLYGTETGLRSFVDTMHRAHGNVLVDLVWNHNGFSDGTRSGFIAQGGYPGFVLTASGVIDGDFHGRTETGDLNGRLSGLIDIKHETNLQYIRTPVTVGDSRNIPAGTTWNIPTAANRRFYPDRGLPGTVASNPLTGRTVTVYDFNTADPTAGDAVPENATGLLMRNARWLVNDVGVDGFRIDAARHFEPWVYGYFDEAVYRATRRTWLDGSRRDVFSVSESASTDRANLLSQFVRQDVGRLPAGQITGNRDALDFAQFWPIKNNLSANGTSNDFRNMVYAGLDVYDDGLVNGSAGTVFVQSHDDFGPDLMNVAHAFSLMRPGNAIVYYNAREHYDPARDFPKPGRGDALGNFGNTITTLVDLRNRYGRGDYRERYIEKENFAFERSGAALVMLSNRNDSGHDARSMQVDFTPGQRLVELTGNAARANAAAGATIIPEVLAVQGSAGNRFVNARFLRNAGKDQGYLVYGLATPRSTAGVELSGSAVGPVISGDDPPEFAGGETSSQTGTILVANAKARLADLRVITDGLFTVRLATQPVTLSDGFRDRSADGDHAMLRINEGLDLNGNGAVDVVAPGDVAYGFENFVTTRAPGFTQAAGNGLYEQVVDARLLPEGMNFLTVRAFRHRNPATGGDGGPAVFSDFKEVLYVDRLAPEAAIAEFKPFAGGVGNNDIWIRSVDGTADRVNVFQNLPATVSDATVIAWANAGQWKTDQIDRDIFKTGFFGVPNGNNTYTVVTREITGRTNVQRFTGIRPASVRGAGFGDLNFDGIRDANDIAGAGYGFERILNSRNAEFNAAADVTGDGLVDNRDLLGLETVLTASGSSAALTSLGGVMFRRVNFQNDAVLNETDLALLRANVGIPTTVDSLWTYDLDVDGAVSDSDVALAQSRFGMPVVGVPASVSWTGGDGVEGGAGTWTATGLAWRGGLTQSGTLPMPLVPGSRAVFSGAGVSVTVSGSVRAAGGLDFRTTGQAVVVGTGPVVLGGTTAGGREITVADAWPAVIAAPIGGSSGLLKTGLGRLTLSGSNPLAGTSSLVEGTLVVANPNAFGTSALVVEGGRLEVNAGVTMRSPALTVADGTLAAASLAVDGGSGIARLTVSGGTVAGVPTMTVGAGGVLSLAADHRVVLGLTGLDVDQVAGGRVDLGRGRIDIAVPGPDAESALRADLVSGRGSGGFSGSSGIMTTGGAAGAAIQPVVGYRVFADGSATVAWAAFGDANLDGRVTQSDINSVVTAGRFGQGGTSASWTQGDFNYDGRVTQSDVNLLLAAALFGQAGYLPAAGGVGAVAAVPEPAVGILGGGVAALAIITRGLGRGRTGRRAGRYILSAG